MNKKFLVFIIIFMAVVLRLINIGQSFWLDEAITVYAVKTYNLTTLVGSYLTGDFHPPLYFVLLWFWTRVFGFGEIAVRMLSVILGVLTVVLVWLVGRRINKTVGLGASFLLAISGYHIYYSQEARMYVLGALLGTLSYYFLLLNLENRDKRFYWFGYFLATLGAIYTDYLLFFLLIPQVLLVLVKKKDFDFLKKYFFVLLGLFVFYLPWLPIVFKQISGASMNIGAFPVWGEVVGGATIKNLLLVPVKFTIGRISFDNKFIYGIFTLIFGGILFFVSIFGIKKDWKSVGVYVYWFVVSLLASFIFSLFYSIFAPFRLLFLLPVFYLIISFGLWKLPVRMRILTLTLIFIFSMFSILQYYLNIRFQREDWRSASYFLSESVAANDQVVVIDKVSYPILLYQTKNLPIVYYENWKDRKDGTIWLVRYAQPIFEPSDKTRKEIERNGFSQYLERDFNGVTVYAYRH